MNTCQKRYMTSSERDDDLPIRALYFPQVTCGMLSVRTSSAGRRDNAEKNATEGGLVGIIGNLQAVI